jgi:hypothetical protein
MLLIPPAPSLSQELGFFFFFACVSGGPLRFWPKTRSVAALFLRQKSVVLAFI